LKRDGDHQFAAFCCLAVARCHQALRNSTLEALSLMDAGHIFWKNEKEIASVNYFGFHENAEEAQHCYLLAIKVSSVRPCLILLFFHFSRTVSLSLSPQRYT
jgi:hypothetical protein